MQENQDCASGAQLGREAGALPVGTEPAYLDLDRSITELNHTVCELDDFIQALGLPAYSDESKVNASKAGLESVPTMMDVLNSSSPKVRFLRNEIEQRVLYLRQSLMV